MRYIPEFHQEYQQRFPKDKRGFEMLKNQYGNAVMLMMMEKNKDFLGTRSEHSSRICLLDSFGTIGNILKKRWGVSLSPELLMFLRSKPSPGEVFLKHPALVCGQMYGDSHSGLKEFQTMRNTW